MAFILKLITVCVKAFTQATDHQIAQAVKIAWQRRGAVQKNEGLFLSTVPECLDEIVNTPPPRPAERNFLRLQNLRELAKVLTGYGPPLADLAQQIQQIIVNANNPDYNRDALDDDLRELRDEVIMTAFNAKIDLTLDEIDLLYGQG